jgi:hypothetical protein
MTYAARRARTRPPYAAAFRKVDYQLVLVQVHAAVAHLVVVACAEIDHDVLVPEEEHDCAWVVQLIHGIEVWHLRDIHYVDDSKVLDILSDTCKRVSRLVQYVIASINSP